MAGFSLRATLDAPLARWGAQAARFGLGAPVLLAAGLAIGLLALPAIALGHGWLGLAAILSSRFVALAGRTNEAGLSAKLAAIFLASLPFAFALADPTRALASGFVLFGFASLVAVRPVDAVAEIAFTLAFAAACVWTNGFSLIAYALGIASFALAGVTLAKGTR